MKQVKQVVASAFLFLSFGSIAQNNVGIGTTTPNPSAILDMQSTNQGVLVPRLTTVQRNAIANPPEGLLVYDIDVNCFFFYETTAGAWTNLCAGGSGTVGPQGPAGPAGTTGQSASTVYSSAALTLSPSSTTYSLVPGLTQTITVPANAKVYISSDGGIQNQNTGINHGVADIAIFIDGVESTLKRRIPAANSNSLGQMLAQWSLSSSFNLTAGSHTIQVRGKYAEGTANVNVGGSADLIKGNLTVLIIKE
ncbi:MAG TPA: hypothetical protein VIK89_05545 [Cytophagaceae bacterium]